VGGLRPGDPREIAGFEVRGRLGEGGMGVVYLASHPSHGHAAVKLVRSGVADPSFRERFRREVDAARRVDSPRVAKVLAAEPDAETPWLATAFVDGPTLGEAVDDAGPMAGERLTALAVALADALAAIHEVGVVHRDLKPSNILLTPETPVVIDFGIAALREAPDLTRTGTALGTPGWMSPEQVRGRRCGPAADVFSWALVVAFAASGRAPFGRGEAEAVAYRIVHEEPDIPSVPSPLDVLMPAALAKEPRLRPTVGQVLGTLTGEPLDATALGDTALGATVIDRTAVVPTIVALGWGVDALPARPDGRVRRVRVEVPAPPPAPPAPPERAAQPDGGGADGERADVPLSPPPPPPPPAPRSGQAAETFWFAGHEHRDARSLATALQGAWEEAVDGIFRRRDPIWLAELRRFLQALGLGGADRIVSAGTGDAPPSATLARLLLELDPNLDPRVGDLWLTPEGLASAAGAVVAGASPAGTADRLADLRTARVLRLWRGLPDMARAASIDERWHNAVEAFDRHVAAVTPVAGRPTPAERQRADATLLLCAVHPEHERRLERRLAAARRTAARHQPWWASLAARGERSPAAAMVAVLTADRARTASQSERRATRAADRQRREHERADKQDRRAAAAATQPRFAPLLRAQSAVRRGWVLAVMLAALVGYVWADNTFGDALARHYETVASIDSTTASGATADRLRALRDASGATPLAVLLLIALPAIHVATRAITREGASRGLVRLYAGLAAAVDLLLGIVLIPVASLAGLVVAAGLEGAVDPRVPAPFGADEPWEAVGLLIPFGLVGLVLIVRAVWRLARAVFGRPVGGLLLVAPRGVQVPMPPGSPSAARPAR
jgi:predicted Ser/Thr protein kinase